MTETTEQRKFSITVNEVQVRVSASPEMPLLWVLRDQLGLKGTKFGCGVGACGICVIHVDGEPVQACQITLAEAANKRITTIEGIPIQHPVVAAWVHEQVPQCGYCQPGQVMTAIALLEQKPCPDPHTIANTLSEVVCRCGTYLRISRAIRWVISSAKNPSHAIDTFAVITPPLADPHGAWMLNPWIGIQPDDAVICLIDRSEMGQGVATGLAMLVAEELEIDYQCLHIAFAPADPVYVNPLIGEQLTGGSTSLRGAWEPLRQAAAEAREKLIAAAANRWNVSTTACQAQSGFILHPPSHRRLAYSALAEAACQITLERKPRLKTPGEFRIIGRSLPRLEIPAMVTGRAVYGLDVTLPGMRVASIERCPYLGGTLESFEASQAKRVPGVVAVFQIPSGVAVVAKHTQGAFQGRAALSLSWKPGPQREFSSTSVTDELERAAHGQAEIAQSAGNGDQGLAEATAELAANYYTPYLAHACMEPMNCTVRLSAGECEIWTGTQAQTATQRMAARLTGLSEEQVRVHTQFLGGGFGRRGEVDFVEDAVRVAQVIDAPVQVVWNRADDLRHDFYRPASVSQFKAGLDAKGELRVWQQRVVGPPLALDGINVPYRIPHLRIEHIEHDPGIPTGPWRSVGASQNAFGIESFVDELAYAAGQDPYQYRHQLLAHMPRWQAVLDLAANKAGWGITPADGRGRGIAFYYSFRTPVAQIAEVSVTDSGIIEVHRIVCALDCGIVINPNAASAQIEGGILFGLSAALHEEITLSQGQVEQSSFANYPVMRFAEIPTIEVHFASSTEPPTGVGEPGVPPVAPAVANALYSATRRRLRALPLRLA